MVKLRLREKFASGEEAFRSMDRDGGGSMDRKEFAVCRITILILGRAFIER